MSRTVTTAPLLLRMESRGARVVAALLVAAMLFSVIADLRGVGSVPLLLGSVVVSALGVALVVMADLKDPMPVEAAVAVASTGPLACVLMCLALPGPPLNANQTNAFGASVAVCAFLCVRGRTGTGWLGVVAMTGVFVWWAQRTGQGAFGGVFYVLPNAALLILATLFALLMRPAAAAITRLRDAAVAETSDIAAAEARRIEGDARRAELRELAWPTLLRVAEGKVLTAAQAAEVDLVERQLRDGVRAKALAVSEVISATRSARARGVQVNLFDDGDATQAPGWVREEFSTLAAMWLAGAKEGTVTVRIEPPGRRVFGCIVAVSASGVVRRAEMTVDGSLQQQ